MSAIKVTTGKRAFLIEVAEEPAIISPSAAGGQVAKAGGKAGAALKQLEDIGDTIADVCDTLRRQVDAGFQEAKPDELTLEFGVKLAGKAGIPLVTEGSAEATFKVVAKWKLGTS